MWIRAFSITGRRRCLQRFLRESSRSAVVPETTGQRRGGADDEMPTARGLPFIGTTLSIIAAGSAPKLHEYVDSRHRQLGPVFREKLGPVDAVLVADPEEMRRVFALEGKYPVHLLPESWVLYNQLYGCKRGLFFMDGEEWLHYRRIMNRLLMRPDSGHALVAPCAQVAGDLVERWRARAGAQVQDLESQLYRWSIDVMLATLMGDAKYSQHKHVLQEVVSELASTVHLVFEKSAQLSLIPARLARTLRLSAWSTFVEVVDSALATANKLVEMILPECQGREGLLGCMVGEGVEKQHVLRIVADLILAAGDTTAYTMQWALYALARHPDVQQRLYTELKGMEDPNDVMKSQLLKNVIREVLRLYPVAPFLTRYLPNDSVIGGYPVKAGQLIILSLYSSGRDEKNFPDPSAFRPERWSRNATGSYQGVNSPYASLPFAMGARSCVGRKIAETQISLTTSKILQAFKLELVDSSPVNLVLRLVAVPSKPVRIWITER